MLGSWNVEGLGHDLGKLQEIYVHMKAHGIAVLCIQETHVKGQRHVYDDGFLVVLSVRMEEKAGRANAGVGFIVAPWATPCIMGFRFYSDRLASLRIRAKGGVLGTFSAYAPHSGYNYETRKEFFDDLLKQWRPTSAHTCCIALGDFNAKLFSRLPGEEDVLGEHVFRCPQRRHLPQTNRELLIETCRAIKALVANTCFDVDCKNLVTCFTMTSRSMDTITHEGFSQIDHCLVDQCAINFVKSMWTDRTVTLQTHHFLLQAKFVIHFGTTSHGEASPPSAKAQGVPLPRARLQTLTNDDLMKQAFGS